MTRNRRVGRRVADLGEDYPDPNLTPEEEKTGSGIDHSKNKSASNLKKYTD